MEQSTHDRKVNEIWDLWAQGKIESPYAELMTYQSEVNNGGHSQFFFNTSQNNDTDRTVNAVLSILDGPLKDNLKRAYDVYLARGNDEDDGALDEFDELFYGNEDVINDLLEKYACRTTDAREETRSQIREKLKNKY